MRKFIISTALSLTLAISNTSAFASGLLKMGVQNEEVATVQEMLMDRGYFKANVTGYYGTITKAAVIEFQKDNGLLVDGIVGPETRSALYGTSDYETDLYWLSRLVEAEAEGESYKGKIAVANCVLNRVASPDYPNTVKGVIFDTKYGVQYTPTANGRIYNTPSTDSINAAKDALSGVNVVGKSMFFYNPKKSTSNWIAANRKYYTTIGNHKFHL